MEDPKKEGLTLKNLCKAGIIYQTNNHKKR